MGAVELTVADLDRTLDYWQHEIGLRVLERGDGRASLGTDTEVLRFVEEPGARPDTGHTGLYHVALLVPDRPSLARWLAHAARDRVQLTGLSDHAVSEAIYLRDVVEARVPGVRLRARLLDEAQHLGVGAERRPAVAALEHAQPDLALPVVERAAEIGHRQLDGAHPGVVCDLGRDLHPLDDSRVNPRRASTRTPAPARRAATASRRTPSR